MDWRFFSLTLLCLAWPGVDALEVNIPEDIYEYARGDNITLPCNFVPASKPPQIIITWSSEAQKANAAENVIVTYYSTLSITDVAPSYEGRASLAVDIAKGKADLKLSSISLADNKIFECRVQIPFDDKGKLVDTARLVVLVAPSVPTCAIQGKAQYGQNINLTCKSAEGSPPPTYKWEGRDVRNVPRVKDPRTTDKGGILSLYNISKETSGYYICTAANKIRSAQCNLTLAVMPPTMSLGSTGKIIGIVAGVVGLIAIIVIIFCCCRRKKQKKQEEKYALGAREDEYHDKEEGNDGESRRPDGQEDHAEIRDRDDRQSDYDDRQSDYDDRRSDYNDRRDRRRDYDDRRRDYDDRRSDYDDRRSDYDDRRRDYDDRRSDYDDRARYDSRDDEGRRDRRYDDRHYDDPHDDRESDRPRVPASKPPRNDYDV